MKKDFSLHGAGKAVTHTGVTAMLFVQSLVMATPVHAFWFFHKHKDQESQQPIVNQPGYYPSGQPTTYLPAQSRYMPGQTRSRGRRLVPAYLYSNSPPRTAPNDQPIKTNTPVALKAAPSPPLVLKNPNNIRVGIGLNLEKTKIFVLDGAQIIDNATGQVLANLPGQSQWIVTRDENQIILQPRSDYYEAIQKLALAHDTQTIEIETAAYYPSPAVTNNVPANMTTLTLPVTDEKFNYTLKAIVENSQGTGKDKERQGLLALNDCPYRGDFIIQNSKSAPEKFNIINILSLEDYLLSVVPSEMPSLWPDEALKAQAIAARSYAIANLGKHGSDGYDVKDNTEDQMYLGVKAESPTTNQAVNSTNSIVLRCDGKPICAYFHSSSGGNTETSENVWSKSLPYLKAVTDFDQDSPMYNWIKDYTTEQVQSALPVDKNTGKLWSITISERSPSGRPTRLLITGSKNAYIISAEAARKYFSLPSTNFNVTPLENAYIFAGKGSGHGLGLSQWGARSLANHGYNAAQILCYYYNGVSIGY